MSHIVTATSTIKHPHRELLHLTMTLVARRYEGGEIKPFYFDYWWNQKRANTGLALHVPSTVANPFPRCLPRGIGLNIHPRSGLLSFVGDPWEVEDFFEDVQQQITQKYVALAAMTVLRQMRYEASSIVTDEALAVSGVRYAS